MSMNYSVDPALEDFLAHHKKWGFSTKTALINAAVQQFKIYKAKEIRKEKRAELLETYTAEENLFEPIEGDDFE